MAWWQFDLTGLSIRLFEKLGLVRSVVRVPENLLEKRRQTTAEFNVQELPMTEGGEPEPQEELLDEAA